MANGQEQKVLMVGGRQGGVSNPRKVLLPEAGQAKLDLAQYCMAVAEGALRGAGGRPNVLVRYPNGLHGEFVYQKRANRSTGVLKELAGYRAGPRATLRAE